MDSKCLPWSEWSWRGTPNREKKLLYITHMQVSVSASRRAYASDHFGQIVRDYEHVFTAITCQSSAKYLVVSMVTTEIVINSTRVMGVRVAISCIVIHGDDAFVCSYRQNAAKRQTAGIKFIHRPNIRFFVPQHFPTLRLQAI